MATIWPTQLEIDLPGLLAGDSPVFFTKLEGDINVKVALAELAPSSARCRAYYSLALTCPCQRLVNPLNRLLNMSLIVRIRVRPSSRTPRVGGCVADRLIVAVAQPAVDGRATTAALAAVATALGVRRQHVELVRGATARDKDLLLTNLTNEEIEQIQVRIQQLCS